MVVVVVECGIDVIIGDLWDWKLKFDIDVVVSNVVLYWVFEYFDLLVWWVDELVLGLWIVVQIFGNFEMLLYVVVWVLVCCELYVKLMCDIFFCVGVVV